MISGVFSNLNNSVIPLFQPARECTEALLGWLLAGFAGGKGKMTNVWVIKCLTVY